MAKRTIATAVAVEAEPIPVPTEQWVLVVDPGSENSAWVAFLNGEAISWSKEPNPRVEERVRNAYARGMGIAIEYPYPRGQMMSYELVETIESIGRMVATIPSSKVIRINRADVKKHLLGRTNGTDAMIRSAIIEMHGGKAAAIGTKAKPGRYHGLKADMWQALAAGLTLFSGAAYVPPHLVERRQDKKKADA